MYRRARLTSVEGVEGQVELGHALSSLQQGSDLWEVKDLLHQLHVVLSTSDPAKCGHYTTQKTVH